MVWSTEYILKSLKGRNQREYEKRGGEGTGGKETHMEQHWVIRGGGHGTVVDGEESTSDSECISNLGDGEQARLTRRSLMSFAGHQDENGH